jgi:diguanylate cyclase (GGDEF)-like protein/PAS domain S-box-containing protein
MNKRHFFYSLPMILLLIVAVVGWLVMDYLSNKAREEIIGESRASALTLSIYVSSTLNNVEGAVKSIAGSPWIAPALLSKGDQDIEQANGVLDRYNSAINASVTYLMDVDGMTVTSSNRKGPDSFLGKSYRFRPYFQEAAKGQPGRYFALGITSGKRGFYASYPVQNRLGKVLGVITMKKDLDDMETFFSQYPFCFLINPDGIIFLSSTPAMLLKSLWPLDKAVRDTLIASQQFGNKLSETVFLKKEIADGMEITLEGKDYWVSRKMIESDGWSIVLLTPTGRIRVYKLIGILATISVCFLIVIFSGVIYVTDQSKAAIRKSEELYKALAEKSIAGVYVVQDGKFRFINSNAASYAGYTREELLDQEAGLLVSPEDRETVRQNARAMLLGEMSSPYEFRMITKQGETRWIMETVTSILHEGRPAILGNSMNITKRKQAEEALRENRSRLADIVAFLPDATLAIDKEKRVIIWNKAIEEMTGVPAAEMIGKGDYAYTIPFYGEARPQLMDLVFMDHKEIAARYPNITREGDSLTAEVFCNALYNNKGAWVFAKASPLHDQSGNIIGAIESIRDITDRKQADEKIRQMAYHDSLTGLPNRTLFFDRLGIALAQSQRNQKGVAITMLDLDNFKDVNDTLGHDVGDLLLKAAAERLSAALRKGDTVARFGGDEFVLILPDLKGIEDVIQVAQKIVDSFRKPFLIDTHQLILTTSIGIAVYPQDGTEEDILLKNADKAMYQAKQTGRDRYQLYKEA